MAKPIVNEIIPFDATKAYTMTFSWTGNMSYNNRIVIYDADTLAPLYDNKYEERHYELNHEIPAGTLRNGGKYAITVTTFDYQDVESAMSDKYYFMTLATPSLVFVDLPDKTRINDAAYLATLSYYQQNGEPLYKYQFHLYNDSKVEKYSSNVMYDTSKMEYKYTELENDRAYFLRATGVTKNNVIVDTGYIQITTHYQDPSIYSKLIVENDNITGFIHYKSNIVVIEADDDDYEYEDSFINLTKKSLTYSKNYTIPKNATIGIRFKDANKEAEFLRCSNKTEPVFSLYSVRDQDTKEIRFALRVFGHNSDYLQYSVPFEIKSWDIVNVFIRRVGTFYGLYVKVEKIDPNALPNVWLQENTPMNGENTDLWINTDYNKYIAKSDVVRIYSDEVPQDAEQYTFWIGGDVL